jgi:hypothetical protein
MMFVHVLSVSYFRDYVLRVTFSDGAVKDVDLQQELWGEVFEPLREVGCFKRVAANLDMNTIEWPNGAGFAPEFLYKLGSQVSEATRAAA